MSNSRLVLDIMQHLHPKLTKNERYVKYPDTFRYSGFLISKSTLTTQRLTNENTLIAAHLPASEQNDSTIKFNDEPNPQANEHSQNQNGLHHQKAVFF